ncbi:MAG: hypothetical protein DRG78_03835 [Epsilonproteobacteria bacterium]|nr:MAG: hypothetical protein DRG78_03835 [Campylobacterota bacterium]
MNIKILNKLLKIEKKYINTLMYKLLSEKNSFELKTINRKLNINKRVVENILKAITKKENKKKIKHKKYIKGKK